MEGHPRHTTYFEWHRDLPAEERLGRGLFDHCLVRSRREQRVQFFEKAEESLKRFNPLSPDFSDSLLSFLKQRAWAANGPYMPLSSENSATSATC